MAFPAQALCTSNPRVQPLQGDQQTRRNQLCPLCSLALTSPVMHRSPNGHFPF